MRVISRYNFLMLDILRLLCLILKFTGAVAQSLAAASGKDFVLECKKVG